VRGSVRGRIRCMLARFVFVFAMRSGQVVRRRMTSEVRGSAEIWGSCSRGVSNRRPELSICAVNYYVTRIAHSFFLHCRVTLGLFCLSLLNLMRAPPLRASFGWFTCSARYQVYSASHAAFCIAEQAGNILTSSEKRDQVNGYLHSA